MIFTHCLKSLTKYLRFFFWLFFSPGWPRCPPGWPRCPPGWPRCPHLEDDMLNSPLPETRQDESWSSEGRWTSSSLISSAAAGTISPENRRETRQLRQTVLMGMKVMKVMMVMKVMKVMKMLPLFFCGRRSFWSRWWCRHCQSERLSCTVWGTRMPWGGRGGGVHSFVLWLFIIKYIHDIMSSQDSNISPDEDADDGEGQQQLHNVQQLLHHGRQAVERLSHRLSEVIGRSSAQHNRLLLQEVRGQRSDRTWTQVTGWWHHTGDRLMTSLSDLNNELGAELSGQHVDGNVQMIEETTEVFLHRNVLLTPGTHHWRYINTITDHI